MEHKNLIGINLTNTGSTGGIMLNTANAALYNGFEVYYSSAKCLVNWAKVDGKTILIGNRFFRKFILFSEESLVFPG